MKNYGVDFETDGKPIPKESKGKVVYAKDTNNNHKVSMREPKTNIERVVYKNLSYYEALTYVWDNRSKKDGNFYWIGGVYR